jgi:very-short-patch-repair endonuclease
VTSKRKPAYLIELAREFRREPTPSEHLLWKHLRGGRLEGLKFRRQRSLGRYIADFSCDSAMLVVEIDGGVHRSEAHREYDRLRDEMIGAHGFRVLRISDEDVKRALPGVLRRIAAACGLISSPPAHSPAAPPHPPTPSPSRGEGETKT